MVSKITNVKYADVNLLVIMLSVIKAVTQVSKPKYYTSWCEAVVSGI